MASPVDPPQPPDTGNPGLQENLMAAGLAAEAILTPLWYYHLLTVFAADLTLWNAQDMSLPTTTVPFDLKGLNPNYQAFDRGCALLVAPKNFYAHTPADRLQAAQCLVLEVLRRGWEVFEGTGFDKMVSAAFVLATVLYQLGISPVRMIGHTPTAKEQEITDTILASPLAQQWKTPEVVEKYIESPLYKQHGGEAPRMGETKA